MSRWPKVSLCDAQLELRCKNLGGCALRRRAVKEVGSAGEEPGGLVPRASEGELHQVTFILGAHRPWQVKRGQCGPHQPAPQPQR